MCIQIIQHGNMEIHEQLSDSKQYGLQLFIRTRKKITCFRGSVRLVITKFERSEGGQPKKSRSWLLIHGPI